MQIRNPAMVRLASGDIQRRYEPNFAWKSVCAQFQALPGLRGFWPMSSFDESGDAYDLSGQGRTLTYNGSPEYAHDGLIHYIDLDDATSDYLGRGDEAGLDILGNESYVDSDARGLTMGGWCWWDTRPSTPNEAHFMAKRDDPGDRSYYLRQWQTGEMQALVSGNGVAEVDAETTDALTLGAWHFAVMRFIPSTELLLFFDGTSYTDTVGVPATIFNSAGDFAIGRPGSINSYYMDGRASLCFLCACALGIGAIRSLYQQSRALFGL